MKLLEELDENHIKIGLQSTTKEAVIEELLGLINTDIKQKNLLLSKILEREALKSTGVGDGIAIPHTETELVSGIHTAIGISKKGINFLSLDGAPVYIVILIVANNELHLKYLSLLAHVARILSDEKIRAKLKDVTDKRELLNIISNID